MAAEYPEEWGKSSYREILTGHMHKRWSDEMNGVIVRICPALCPADKWHSDNGYVGNRRAAEAFVYDYEGGLRAIFNYDVPPTLAPALID